MLLHHASGEALELTRTGFEPLCQMGICERGSDLSPECHEEVFVQGCERIAGSADDHDGSRDFSALQHG